MQRYSVRFAYFCYFWNIINNSMWILRSRAND